RPLAAHGAAGAHDRARPLRRIRADRPLGDARDARRGLRPDGACEGPVELGRGLAARPAERDAPGDHAGCALARLHHRRLHHDRVRLLLSGDRPRRRRGDRPARLPDPAGRLPAPDPVRDPVQPHRRSPVLQARPAGDLVSAGAAEALVAPPVPSRWTRFRRNRVLASRQAQVGLVILGLFVITGIFGPLALPHGPQEKVGPVFQSPSWAHLFGTDGGGADMFFLMIQGASVSLLVGFAAAAVSAVIGGTVGLLAGFFGGKTDIALMRLTDYFLVIPDIPLMIVVAALFG